MKIKIVVTDKENGTNKAIFEALKSVNGNATQHTITSSKYIIELANEYEKILYRLVGKKSVMPGAVVSHQSGGKLPNAYKYSRVVTYVELTRGSDNWYLTNCQTATAWNDAGKTSLKLTEKQDTEVIANLHTQYNVIHPITG